MRKSARYLYFVIASLFLIAILSQVYFVGLTLIGGQPSMDNHIRIGQFLGIPTLLMILLAYLGRMSTSMKRLSWLSFIIFTTMVLILFLRNSVPFVAALHPILALILFAVTVWLEIGAWQALREPLDSAVQSAAALKRSGVGEPAAR